MLAARMLAKPLLSQLLSNLLLHKVFQLLLQGVSTSRLGDVWIAVAWRLLLRPSCHRWWRITRIFASRVMVIAIRGIPCRWRAMRERLRRPIRVLRRRRSWKMRVAWRRWALNLVDRILLPLRPRVRTPRLASPPTSRSAAARFPDHSCFMRISVACRGPLRQRIQMVSFHDLQGHSRRLLNRFVVEFTIPL